MDIKFLDRNKDEYKIVLFGDSITRGVIFDEEQNKYKITSNNYVTILADYLKAGVDNTARFGNTIIRALKKIQKIIDKRDHDIALIEFGGNDCDFNWDEIANDPTKDHKPKTEFKDFETRLSSLVTYIKKNDMFPVLFTIPPIDSDRFFNWVSHNDDKNKKNILKFLGTISKIHWWQERYNSLILSVAASTETHIIDIRSAFLRNDDYRNLLCIDGIHPNELGHKIIADTIYDYVQTKYSFLIKKK